MFANKPWCREWFAARPAVQSDVVTPIFMLKHDPATLARLEDLFWAVSTPGNSQYGKHITNADLAKDFAPSPAATKDVLAWLDAAGVSKRHVRVSAARDMIEAPMSVAVAEQLFQTTFTVFHHPRRADLKLVRATAPHSLPAEIAAHVAVVGDIVALPRVQQRLSREQDATNATTAVADDWPMDCDKGTGLFHKCGSKVDPFVTIGVLTQRYSLGEQQTTAAGSMSVAEFQGVMYDNKDFRTFEAMCGIPNGTISVARQIGNDAPAKCEIPIVGGSCVEALLDIEYIKAVAGSVPLTDIYSSGYSLLNWAMQLGSMDDPPLINSVSYGNDERQQTSVAFMNSVNVQFQKLGVKGLSVLFASGDQGVWGRSGQLTKAFNPDFPAGSPYVTAVGGTDFATKSVIGDEKAWSSGGGGFSNTFGIPAYQANFVANFKSQSTSLPPQSYWNNTGRGYPDVAALGGMGNPYCVVSAGAAAGVAGTSAACPVAAAVFAKLNELRLAAKKAPLGFLNPFICGLPGAGRRSLPVALDPLDMRDWLACTCDPARLLHPSGPLWSRCWMSQPGARPTIETQATGTHPLSQEGEPHT